MIVPQFLPFVVRWRHAWLYPAISILLFSFFLAACSDSSPGGNSTTGPTASSPSSSQVAIAQLHWCGKPVMLFRDEGAQSQTGASPTPKNTVTGTSTPTPIAAASVTPPVAGTPKTITDWNQVEPNLGFTVYLPTTLPQHSCLVSALGTIHDPIFGGSFTIGYLLPDHSSISLAEAPLRGQSTQFQCNVSTTASASSSASVGVSTELAEGVSIPQRPSDSVGGAGAELAERISILRPSSMYRPLSDAHFNPSPLSASPTPMPTRPPDQICSGAMNTTNIIFSARGTTESLQQFFNALQPNVNWIPAS